MVLVDLCSHHLSSLQSFLNGKSTPAYLRGDIIVSTSPTDNNNSNNAQKDKLITKRVIAIEGDLVIVSNNVTQQHTIDSIIHTYNTSPTPSTPPSSSFTDLIIPKLHANHITYYTINRGYIWLAGDNRFNSKDSRYFGPVPVNGVYGRVLCSLCRYQTSKLFNLDISYKALYNTTATKNNNSDSSSSNSNVRSNNDCNINTASYKIYYCNVNDSSSNNNSIVVVYNY